MMRAESGRWRASAVVALCGVTAAAGLWGWRITAVPDGALLEVRRPSSLVVASNWLRHVHRPWMWLVNAGRRRRA